MTRSTRRMALAIGAALAASLTLASCGSEGGGGGASETTPEGSDSTETSEEAPAGGGTVRIGIPSGWDEGIAVSHLWKAILEDAGYTVDTTTAEIGPLFTSLAGGDLDLMFDGWLPLTHADYWEEYGDDLVDLGVWYDDAALTIAVNEDSPAQSLEDLAGMASEYGNRIVGIEPGAGLTAATQNAVIPTYGLEGMDFVTSSTPAMLAELSAKVDSGENVVVTLWRPHWAYDAFPVRDLDDPEGTLGEAEEVHTFGAADVEERLPEVVEWVKAFELTDEQLFSLENVMFNEDDANYTEDPDEAVAFWLGENPTFVEDLKG